jgi:hypothetical protein
MSRQINLCDNQFNGFKIFNELNELLNWLVYGDPYEKAFPVEIDSSKPVGILKKKIKENISENVTARDLKLSKVDILLGESREENVVLLCKIGELGSIGVEMKNLDTINKHFNRQPVNTNLHITVKLPVTATSESKILV